MSIYFQVPGNGITGLWMMSRLWSIIERSRGGRRSEFFFEGLRLALAACRSICEKELLLAACRSICGKACFSVGALEFPRLAAAQRFGGGKPRLVRQGPEKQAFPQIERQAAGLFRDSRKTQAFPQIGRQAARAEGTLRTKKEAVETPCPDCSLACKVEMNLAGPRHFRSAKAEPVTKRLRLACRPI